MRPPTMKGRPESTQLVNPFALNQAILIGLSAEIPGLGESIARMQKALHEPEGIFPEFEIQSMTDLGHSGNRTILVHRLNALAEGSQVQPFENLLLYFVGHAERKPSYRLLLPERIFSSEVPIEDRDWLGWETLCEWLAPVRAKNLLIVLDTCYANQLHHRDTMRWLRELDQQEPGQKIILAANCDEPLAWEREWTCFFTEAFVEAVEGWNARNDLGVVDVDALFHYLSKRVPEIAHHKTNRAEIQPYPFRLAWPERAPTPMVLTHEKARAHIDERLKEAILDGRCLLWVGDALKNRATPKDFPNRAEWESVQRDVWLEYVDSQRAPGVACMQLAALGMSVLDTAIDASLEKAAQKRDMQLWVPMQGSQVPAKEQPMLIRLCGEMGSSQFVYEWEDLEQRFDYFLRWLGQSRRWDTLLLMGFPLEELAARNWLKSIRQTVKHCWMVFPFLEDHDRVPWLRQLGIHLLFVQESDFMRQLKDVARIGIKRDRTELVRFSFPKRKPQKGRDIASTPNPYRGLLPFGEHHYDIFFGRHGRENSGGELQALRQDVLNHQKVLFYGESGCGKTSLLHAGLFPVLQSMDGYRIFSSDADDPLQDIAQKAAQEPYFLESPDAHNVLERLGFLSQHTGRPVLICIDHIERTLIPPPAGRSRHSNPPRFLEILDDALRLLEQTWPVGQWRLLLCVRKEAYIHLTPLLQKREDNPAMAVFHRELLPLQEAAAKEAICAPLVAPFRIEDELLERLLVDLRQWRPGAAPTYDPFWLQTVCRDLFEKARKRSIKRQGKKDSDPVLSLALYSPKEGGFLQYLEQLFARTMRKMPNATRLAAQDVLSLLVHDQGARRHRAWPEMVKRLEQHHRAEALNEAKETLLNRQILRERRIVQGTPHLELTHDILVRFVEPYRNQDLELANQVIGHLEQQSRHPTVFSKQIMQRMKVRGGFLDRIPAEKRADVAALKDTSQRHYRKRILIQSAVGLLVAILAVAGWIFMPKTTGSSITFHIGELLNDTSTEQNKFWASINYLKSEPVVHTAQKRIAARLLDMEGSSACKLLKALHHLSQGRVGETIRQAIRNRGAYSITRLKCPPDIQFQRIELRGAQLKDAKLSKADFTGASLQESQWQGADLQQSKFFNANLLKANLQYTNLQGANLEGAQMQYANLQGSDLRDATLHSSALNGANLTGAMISASQIKALGEAGASLQQMLCLSNQSRGQSVSGAAALGPALACYRWHRDPAKQSEIPAGCPATLRGPILVFAQLSREGKCPKQARRIVAGFSAYCPPNNRAACKQGEACQRGDGASCLALGQRYIEGQGVTKSTEVGSVLLRRACVLQTAAGCSQLAMLYWEGKGLPKNLHKAFSLFEQACKQGDMAGCTKLGLCYERAIVAKLNLTKARELFDQACKADIPEACARYGIYVEHGRGVKRDRKAAAGFYQRACEKDDALGCYWSGVYYEKHAKNKRRAEEAFRKANPLLAAGCSQQLPDACHLWAKMYESGSGVRRDLSRAKALYETSCQQKLGGACNDLASLYFYGRGVKKSMSKALSFYLKACEQYSGDGCDNLGSMYERGKGIRKNRSRARRYYQKSCDLGNGWGCNDLAELYYSGKGVRRNRSKARKLYRLACKLGVEDACK